MIEIKKAKITKVATMEIEYKDSTRIEKETLGREVSVKCDWVPHEDLFKSFKKLVPFLVDLCDQKKQGGDMELPFDNEDIKKEVEEAALSDYTVTGFTIGGSDEHEGVTLIGRKKLANNRVLNLVSPFTKWEDEHNGYARSYELQQAVEECQSEVELYLTDYKRAPVLQTALEFGEEENDPETAF